mmetsp:Transcript_98070/g.245723  ORF Transcript_98070/g.245723 Transcript_98070/m.245723 type:complete len:270 (+) Transcript_98070:1087-1896(+)
MGSSFLTSTKALLFASVIRLCSFLASRSSAVNVRRTSSLAAALSMSTSSTSFRRASAMAATSDSSSSLSNASYNRSYAARRSLCSLADSSLRASSSSAVTDPMALRSSSSEQAPTPVLNPANAARSTPSEPDAEAEEGPLSALRRATSAASRLFSCSNAMLCSRKALLMLFMVTTTSWRCLSTASMFSSARSFAVTAAWRAKISSSVWRWSSATCDRRPTTSDSRAPHILTRLLQTAARRWSISSGRSCGHSDPSSAMAEGRVGLKETN